MYQQMTMMSKMPKAQHFNCFSKYFRKHASLILLSRKEQTIISLGWFCTKIQTNFSISQLLSVYEAQLNALHDGQLSETF